MMADKEQAGVVIFFDIEPALEILSAEQRGHLFTAIIQYAHYGIIPTFEDQLVNMAWAFVRPSIDRANKKYEKSKEKKRIAGITSDFKRNYAPRHGIDPEDKEELNAYIHQRMSADVDFGDVTGDGSGIETEIEIGAGIESLSVHQDGGGDGGCREEEPRRAQFLPPAGQGITEEQRRKAIRDYMERTGR